MKNIKRLLSLCFALVLLLSLSPAAYALDNNTDITGNNNTDFDNNNATININKATITNNYGTVKYNHNTVENNHEKVEYTNGTVTNNYDYIEFNDGTVINNSGHIWYNHYGVVINNLPGGEVGDNLSVVWYNLGGTVNGNAPEYNYFRINCPSGYDPAQLLTVSGTPNVDTTAPSPPPPSGVYDGNFYLFPGLDLQVKVPSGYTLEVSGSCTLEEKDGVATLYNVASDISIRFIPIPTASSVPATGDNSNSPLWSGLFLAFTALALVTKKKKA